MQNIKKVFFAVFFASLIPGFANAASFVFQSSASVYQKGDTFSVDVIATSPTQAINAVSGGISFPKELLAIKDISKTGSIVSLWTQEPQYSETSGEALFEGVILNPGFKGDTGKLITINFMVKELGDATISFSSASALANDGLATNILSNMGTLKLSFHEKAASLNATSTQETNGVRPINDSGVHEMEIPAESTPVVVVNLPESITSPVRSFVEDMVTPLVHNVVEHPLITILIVLGIFGVTSVLFSFWFRITRFIHILSRDAGFHEAVTNFFKPRTAVPATLIKKHITALKKAKKTRDLTIQEETILKDLEDVLL